MVSDPEEHLRWCLKKDQIEFDSPNEMLAEDYLNKAREALEVADLLEENGYYDWTITACKLHFSSTQFLPKIIAKITHPVDNCQFSLDSVRFSFPALSFVLV